MWVEKHRVRRGFIELSLGILKRCRGTLSGNALDSCFETVLSGLSDSSEENKAVAICFLRDCVERRNNLQIQQRLTERLAELIKKVQPPNGEFVDTGEDVEQRLARVDGLLHFLVG